MDCFPKKRFCGRLNKKLKHMKNRKIKNKIGVAVGEDNGPGTWDGTTTQIFEGPPRGR